jgi:CheY-like chemotaxis protein
MQDVKTMDNTTITQNELSSGLLPKLPFILLAEDDDNDAFGIELAFKKVGLKEQFRRVRDGDEAIEYLIGAGKFQDRASFPVPSLLLVDLKMAGKDGFALLTWLGADPRWKNIVSVVLTNSEADSDKERAYGLGAKSYLVKPSNFKSFTEMLQLLERYWSMNQVPASRT